MIQAVVITGTAPHSFGDKLIIEFASKQPHNLILSIDRIVNPAFQHLHNVRQICIDLDAFASQHVSEFSDCIYKAISEALYRESVQGIKLMCFSAGTYEYGAFAELSANQRQRLYGLNILGKAETLHAALQINRTLGFDNSAGLTVGDIGSLHGLRLSPLRSLYAASKAFGLDFLTAIQRGEEIHRGVHIALGPVDTHMLHRNHWISKTGAPPKFFETIRANGDDTYTRIFSQGDVNEFIQWVRRLGEDEKVMLGYFDKYLGHRDEVGKGRDGILDASTAAAMVYQALNADSPCENLYVFTAPYGVPTVKCMSFNECDRSSLCVGGETWHNDL